MSYSCTLHPVDLRIVKLMEGNIRNGRADWKLYLRLYQKKQLINGINQPLKKQLPELLGSSAEYNPDLHLWGRPFLIHDNNPDQVMIRIDQYYGAVNEKDVLKIFSEEARKFLAPGAELNWRLSKLKPAESGIKSTMKLLGRLFREGKYPELGAELGFVLAQLLAAAYPYWYVESFGLSFWLDLGLPEWGLATSGQTVLFKELPEVWPYLPTRLSQSLSAGVYLDQQQVRQWLAHFTGHFEQLLTRLGEKQFPKDEAVWLVMKLIETLTYADSHGFGVLEASDIYEEGKEQYP